MKYTLCIFLLLTSLTISGNSDITIYISPSGNNQNPGTRERPLATLNYAWQKVSGQAGKQPVTLYCQGTNYLSEPIVITGKNSGTKECPVRFCAYPGEEAVISSSKRLKDLRWSSYKNGIMQAQIEERIAFDQLFINGERQVMARYPNLDKKVHIFNGYAADAISPERVKGWKNPSGGYLHAMHRSEWGGYQYMIRSKSENGELTLDGGFQNNRQMGMHPKYRMVENILEELDAEGEWYFDSTTRTLYFYPTQGLNLQTAIVEVPQTESLFILRGTPENPVRYVQIEGLELTQTLRTFMKTEEPLLRSDWKIYRGGALMIENAETCSISGCYIHDIGGNAIFFSSYNRNHQVRQNHITHIGASAICFVGLPRAVRSPLFEYNESQTWEQMDKGTGPLTNDYPADCTVEDNLIHSIGETEKQGAGVQISMSARITLRHNSIYDLPRAGINISEGTWGGHLIEENDVFNTVLETGDHGSFNSWGRDRYWHPDREAMNQFVKAHPQMVFQDAVQTTVIRNNRWRCDHGWDIDLDDGSSNYHIYNNLCLNGGLKLREGFARKVENNVLVNNAFHPHVWFEACGDIFRYNIVTTGHRPIQVKEWGKEIDYNFFADTQGLANAHQNGTDAHSLAGDPQFVCPAEGDYRVKETSPALQVGFRNFDMNHFGVQCPRLKALAATPSLPLFQMLETKAETIRTHSWKGLILKEVSTEGERSATGLDRIRGILILKTNKPGDALKPNDVILKINGKPTNTMAKMQAETARLKNAPKVSMTILRNQKEIEVIYR